MERGLRAGWTAIAVIACGLAGCGPREAPTPATAPVASTGTVRISGDDAMAAVLSWSLPAVELSPADAASARQRARKALAAGDLFETADAAILRNRVTDVAGKIRLARAAMANIRQNVAIALGLKAVFLVTTILGITGLWIAILADTGATVLVTLNALRLLAFDPEREA